ncbi:MAG TPA: heavy metal-binding domain-containing protein, partial [Candidatus Limnocylindrales bacterium]|nr:heavy metal-binding domain-containing protein [Candidatus Limnocylindrales bacterium]
MNEDKREETPKDTGSEVPGGPPESPERPRKKSRLIAVAAAVALLLGAGTLAFFTVPAFHNLLHPHPADNAAKIAQGAAKYTCGMHPFIISDKPGKCPICGMTLTKIEDAAPAAAAAQGGDAGKGERKILFYRNPMNPGDTSPVPAKDAMGMDYVPVYEDEAGSGAGAVEGYSTIKVGDESLRL